MGNYVSHGRSAVSAAAAVAQVRDEMVREIRATQRAPVDDDASPDSVGEEVDEATASGTSPATHRVAFRDTAPPPRQSSEQLSESLISSVEGRARAAAPRLSGSQVRQVYRYIGRLRLLQELSREFAHYNDLCREPMAAALNPIRAMAFSGGGVLGTAYVGALLVLEEHGLDYGRIRRFAGASAGAIMAATLAVGFRAAECMEQLQKLDFEDLIAPDLAALTHGRGVSSGRRLERWMGQVLKTHTGDADITLGDVLQRYGKELIIVATELDTGRERKFNPHTDPQLPVKTAVRMSAGIPVVFDVYSYQGHQYADGGLVNNWPVDCLPRDGTGMGIVAFTFTDYVCQDLFRLLWGHIPPERRVFDFERVGKSFAKVLYTHPERAESMFAVAKQSLRVIYDRLTKEQLWRYAHTHPRLTRMPHAVFLCVGEYGALDVEISGIGQLELLEMGRLSMYVEAQRLMLERECAHLLGTEAGAPARALERDNSQAVQLDALFSARSADISLSRRERIPETVLEEPELNEADSFTVPVPSGGTLTPIDSTVQQLASRTQLPRSASDLESPRLQSQRVRQEWEAPEELYWRLTFLLSRRETERLDPHLRQKLFPRKLFRDRDQNFWQRVHAKRIRNTIVSRLRGVWQNVRICTLGCFAVCLQCVTCCQAGRCVRDAGGVGPQGYASPGATRVSRETKTRTRRHPPKSHEE
ncbi:hypothetical protein CDCA_CDCA08G2492 [Cyanidium caldarium]|uniref:PNPLA domain-containing protein n=1 Tax=Cyanidium caldarium TaxID=2771 RepID=A0AAV9IW32_CYACA|nr:hypothetical protein CDCA_CDCA08G2492 [Cyanidium caldarium]